MICLVISSVSSLLYEVKHQTFIWAVIFKRFVVTVFIIEYLLRGWMYSDIHTAITKQHENSEYLDTPFRLYKVLGQILVEKLSYIFSPSATIDLLAILPSYRAIFSMAYLYNRSISINTKSG